jgi:cardiolipin synthase
MLTTLPNVLTLSRIVAIPLVIVTFYFEGDLWRWVAVVIYAAACVTDFFDGYFARRRNLISSFGRFLDPIADKLLVSALLLMLAAFDRMGQVTALPAAVILCRELLVSGLREFLAETRVSVPVSRLAKWKTGIQMTALGFLLVGDAGNILMPARLIGEIGLWAAAILTLITGFDYLAAGLPHLTSEAPLASKVGKAQDPA